MAEGIDPYAYEPPDVAAHPQYGAIQREVQRILPLLHPEWRETMMMAFCERIMLAREGRAVLPAWRPRAR
jgi:hypothetical protein